MSPTTTNPLAPRSADRTGSAQLLVLVDPWEATSRSGLVPQGLFNDSVGLDPLDLRAQRGDEPIGFDFDVTIVARTCL